MLHLTLTRPAWTGRNQPGPTRILRLTANTKLPSRIPNLRHQAFHMHEKTRTISKRNGLKTVSSHEFVCKNFSLLRRRSGWEIILAVLVRETGVPTTS